MTEQHTPWAPGTPCWVDLATPDPAAAQTFYAALFGWTFDDTGEQFGHYLLARKDGLRVAGVGSPPPGTPMPTAWTTFLATADAEATTVTIPQAGGSVIAPIMEIGTDGKMFVAMDPAGAAFGVWEGIGNPGFELANEPGSVAWNECMSRDYEAAKGFYGAVFGYGFLDLGGDDFSYAAATIEGRPVGGVGGAPSELPSHWMCYFKVADCDASAAQVIELGGSVQREPWDTPFGRMATVSDAQGAAFSLMADTPESIANAANGQ